MVITAGSSSFCFFSAADAATTMAAVVDAATTVDADSVVPVRAYQAKAEDHSSALLPVFFSAFFQLFFLSAVFLFIFQTFPCPVHKKHFHPVPVFFCHPYISLLFSNIYLMSGMPLCS